MHNKLPFLWLLLLICAIMVFTVTANQRRTLKGTKTSEKGEIDIYFPGEKTSSNVKFDFESYVIGVENATEVQQRFDDDTYATASSLCDVVMRIITPNREEAVTDGLMYDIAQADGHSQGVHIEECRNVSRTCRVVHDSLPNGMISKCIQKFSEHRLLAVVGGKLKAMNFRFPSCCQCTLLYSKP